MFRRISLFTIPLLMFGTLAQATTLVTPSVSSTNVDNTVDCRIVNAGNKPITVLIEMVNEQGVVILDDEFDIPAGGARAIDLTDQNVVASCRFSGQFAKGAVRGSVSILDSLTRTTSIAPAE